MILNTAWDGQDRISVLISDIIGVKTEQEAIYVRKWLHQTVSMAFNSYGVADNADNADNAEPSKSYESCEPSELYELYGADGVLVLVGEQGNGKTMLVSKLAVNDDWFIGGRLLSFNKDNVMINTSHWITELCYVDNLSARERAFLTASSDISRSITKPRLTSFCATLNEMPKVAKNGFVNGFKSINGNFCDFCDFCRDFCFICFIGFIMCEHDTLCFKRNREED